jgi:maltose-binding protein MalE
MSIYWFVHGTNQCCHQQISYFRLIGSSEPDSPFSLEALFAVLEIHMDLYCVHYSLDKLTCTASLMYWPAQYWEDECAGHEAENNLTGSGAMEIFATYQNPFVFSGLWKKKANSLMHEDRKIHIHKALLPVLPKIRNTAMPCSVGAKQKTTGKPMLCYLSQAI